MGDCLARGLAPYPAGAAPRADPPRATRAAWPLLALAAALGCGSGDDQSLELVDNSDLVREDLARRSLEGGSFELPEGARLELEEMPVELAERFFPGIGRRLVYDPVAYFFTRPHMNSRVRFGEHPDGGFRVVTNSLGMREDGELAAAPPALRVLVTGDSHTDGVCNNDESFANLLEVGLRSVLSIDDVEVLNAGCGSYNFHNYLGLYEKFRELEPDVFLVCVYGGNDFKGDLKTVAWNRRLQLPEFSKTYRGRQRRALLRHPNAFAQAFQQLAWFEDVPQVADLALTGAQDVLGELALRCAEDGVELVVAWLPPASDVEWEVHATKFDALTDLFELDAAALARNDTLADTVLATLGHLEDVHTVDLREPLRDGGGPYFWKSDLHLNTAGHRRVARALLPVVSELAEAP